MPSLRTTVTTERRKRPPKTATMLIRDIPRPVWTAFTARAKREGRTAKGALLLLIHSYVRFGLPNGTTDDEGGGR